ncbi:MAG: GNAT family N-acetyltransferase [Methanobacteriota archaeon]
MIDARRVVLGERVLLRPLGSGDLRRLVKWFSDPRVSHFLGRTSGVTLAEEERWFREYERKVDEQVFAIEVEGKHVGNVGLHKVDRAHRKADLGVLIGEATLWSRGYGTDAIRAALRYAFEVLGLHKVSLDVLEYNHRAIRAYEKVGFVREGVHRQDIYKDGRFVDVVRMSILAGEFRAKEPAPIPA